MSTIKYLYVIVYHIYLYLKNILTCNLHTCILATPYMWMNVQSWTCISAALDIQSHFVLPRPLLCSHVMKNNTIYAFSLTCRRLKYQGMFPGNFESNCLVPNIKILLWALMHRFLYVCPSWLDQIQIGPKVTWLKIISQEIFDLESPIFLWW